MSFIDFVQETSNGLKRRAASLLLLIGTFSAAIPGLNVISPYILAAANWLGVAGVAHAAVAGTVTTVSPLSTIAAALAGLAGIMNQITVLQPYYYIVEAAAVFFATLAAGSVIGGGVG